MTSEVPRSSDEKMSRRMALAEEFFAVTRPELVPFVSDEASWFDFDYLDTHQLAAIVKEHYGISLDEATLTLPFWKFLDYLDEERAEASG